MSKTCKKCGHKMAENAIACKNCGAVDGEGSATETTSTGTQTDGQSSQNKEKKVNVKMIAIIVVAIIAGLALFVAGAFYGDQILIAMGLKQAPVVVSEEKQDVQEEAVEEVAEEKAEEEDEPKPSKEYIIYEDSFLDYYAAACEYDSKKILDSMSTASVDISLFSLGYKEKEDVANQYIIDLNSKWSEQTGDVTTVEVVVYDVEINESITPEEMEKSMKEALGTKKKVKVDFSNITEFAFVKYNLKIIGKKDTYTEKCDGVLTKEKGKWKVFAAN